MRLTCGFVLALAAQIPVTNEVFINERSQGKGSEMEGQMNTCHMEVYQPPLSMGIIEKGQTVKVVGSDVKVLLHMRGRCNEYGHYDYQVGQCSTEGAGAGGETVAESWTATHAIQSYEILQCGRAEVADNSSWQDNMGETSDEINKAACDADTCECGYLGAGAYACECDSSIRCVQKK